MDLTFATTPTLPTSDTQLSLELRLTPRQDRVDAAQEAWVAHLTGRNPARAVATYAQRERRRRVRERTQGLR